MTVFRFTPTYSAHTTGAGVHAFESDSPGADTLIVDFNGQVRADGAGAIGALLHNTKAWTVQVNGLVHSEQWYGIGLDVSNTATSTIRIGASGTVHGGTDAIVANSASRIDNGGTIAGSSAGISLGGYVAHTINNAGTIDGAYAICDLAGLSRATITNSGALNGAVDLGDQADKLTNTGQISDIVQTGGGDDTVVNAKNASIVGTVDLGAGNNKLTNAGNIGDRVRGGDGNDTVTNSGNIAYTVSLGDGLNKLTNTGNIAHNVFGGDDRDVVKNNGAIAGYVDLGGGNDSYTGGKYGDYVADSAGSDSTNLGSGNDIYYGHGDLNPADDGIDTVDGGVGYDVYDASTATDSVYINLDKVAHDASPLFPAAGIVAAGTASGTQVGTDKIRNFEEAIGGSGNDVMCGSALANVLEGGKGSDLMSGFGGDDVLIGGEGDDTLAGGTGRDLLYSGAGYDLFVFTNIAHSGASATTRDRIMDFESGIDLIILSPIDAITTNGPGDDTFNFIGAQAFSGVAGQLRAYATADGQIVEGDVNGDGRADFSIELAPNPLLGTLTAGDFVL